MNTFPVSRPLSVALAFGVLFVGAAFAQTHDHSSMGNMQMTAAKSNATPMAGTMNDGEIKKVDMKAQTITLKHGPIKSLEMPAMTMSYPVKNPALLEKVKPGDKVKFSAEMNGKALSITAIELVK